MSKTSKHIKVTLKWNLFRTRWPLWMKPRLTGRRSFLIWGRTPYPPSQYPEEKSRLAVTECSWQAKHYFVPCCVWPSCDPLWTAPLFSLSGRQGASWLTTDSPAHGRAETPGSIPGAGVLGCHLPWPRQAHCPGRTGQVLYQDGPRDTTGRYSKGCHHKSPLCLPGRGQSTHHPLVHLISSFVYIPE